MLVPLPGKRKMVAICLYFIVNYVREPKYAVFIFSNGILDDYSPAQSLNKLSASTRGTRSTTNAFSNDKPTSHEILPVSTTVLTNSANSLTIKSSKVHICFKRI